MPLPPHGIQRIKRQAGRAILIGNFIESPAGEKVQRDDLQVGLIVSVLPEVNGLRREAAVGES